mmetsp:Transcript_39585/g.95186  ORF Transcript_39585/g.95186 Transcript_39585/m.95186 type:complete len:215 (+) Transcript_39585:630-1274(+)
MGVSSDTGSNCECMRCGCLLDAPPEDPFLLPPPGIGAAVRKGSMVISDATVMSSSSSNRSVPLTLCPDAMGTSSVSGIAGRADRLLFLTPFLLALLDPPMMGSHRRQRPLATSPSTVSGSRLVVPKGRSLLRDTLWVLRRQWGHSPRFMRCSDFRFSLSGEAQWALSNAASDPNRSMVLAFRTGCPCMYSSSSINLIFYSGQRGCLGVRIFWTC